MRTLAIDPGLATIGYAVVDHKWPDLEIVTYGAIRVPKEMEPVGIKLHFIADRVRDIMSTYEPTDVAMEELFFSRNVTSALKVSQAIGVMKLVAYQHYDEPPTIAEYKPTVIKTAVAGDGKANKEVMQESVRLYFQLDEKVRPDDAADALAIAITHITFRVQLT